MPSNTIPTTNNHQNETKQSLVGGSQVPAPASLAPADSHATTGGDSVHPHPDRGSDGADKALISFDLFRKQANLDGIDINQQGSRHSSLLAILSAGASRVLSEDDLRRVVAIRMPEFSREHDCQQLIIQEIDADMTNPAFVMRTAEAQEHFLYTSLNEIDQFDALKGQGNQQFRIMCLAFDPGNQYGQTRVGTQSVTERVCVRFNWNASTTIHKGQKYFSRVLTDGPISRINFCTIPEREIGAEMPIYGTYDDAFREQLRPYIENLCRATGQIDCAEAYQLALRLKDENADFARMSQSRIYENLSFRANVIAWLKACVLYVANGCQWEAEIVDFIRWSEQYDLWCKMRFFGDAIAKSENDGVKSSLRGPQNMLQQLPDVFTQQEVETLRLQNGLNKEGTQSMLTTWVYRKYIRRCEPGENDSCHSHSCHSFEKLKYRTDGAEVNNHV